MKFWELDSVCRDQPGLLIRKAAERAEWYEYAEWGRKVDELVRTQDRAKLDFELPDAYVRGVLHDCSLVFYRGKDGWLRSYRLRPDDTERSPLEAYEEYGGSALEDALEKGSVPPVDRGGRGPAASVEDP